MIQKIAGKLVDSMSAQGYLSENEDIYRYGIQLLLSYLISLVLIFSYALYQRALGEAIFFTLLFGNIRKYTGGYHAKSFLSCNISFLVVFILYLVSLRSKIELYILFMVANAVLVHLTPIAHRNKPISQEEKEYYRSRSLLSLLLCMIFTVLFTILDYSYAARATSLITIITAILAVLGWIDERRRNCD